MSTLIIGVDPGQKGAIVMLDDRAQVHFAWAADASGAKNTVPGYFVGAFNARGLAEELRLAVSGHVVARCIFETPLAFAKGGVSSALSTGIGWGQLRATFALVPLPVEETTPAKWSTTMLGKPPPGGWKGAKKQEAIDLCRARLPGLNLVLPGCRKPHDGLADAAVMALYGLREVR